MATSIQIVGGIKELFKDLDLIAFIYLLEPEKAPIGQQDPITILVARMWKEDLKGYGPGTIDLKLEEMGSGMRASSLKLVRDARKMVEKMGDYVPASLLNDRNRIPGIAFYDLKKELLLDTIIKLERLLVDGKEENCN